MFKRIRNLLFAIFVLSVMSCGKSSVAVVETSEMSSSGNNIENEINTSVSEIEQAKNKIEVKDEEMDIPFVAIIDKSEAKTFEELKIFNSAKEYPKVDGSTALLPLMAHIRKNALGEDLEDAENETSCTKTNEAWYNLSNGKADVLIVGEMPNEVKNDLKNYIKSGKEQYKRLKFAPVRREGLVFIVNKNNPVESLTKQQLIDIYTGKITNWKEVGGNDSSIEAFQREEKSGSQTIFRKVLMKGTEPIKKEVYYYSGEMDVLIDTLASYNNSNNAIGYSVYYYVTEMYKNDNLKLIKVDGVMPSNETIADFSYPLLNESYVSIRLDEPESSNAHKLYDYIRSNKGRVAIIEAGYVPVG